MKRKLFDRIIVTALVLAMAIPMTVGAVEVAEEQAVVAEEMISEEVITEAEEAIETETVLTAEELVTDEVVEEVVVDAAEEVILDDEAVETIAEAIEADEEVLVDDENLVDELAIEDEDVSVADGVVADKVITGAVDFDINAKALTYDANNKPSLDTVLADMPATIKVKIEGQKNAEEIPVTWFCVGDDYEASNGYYFQFSPVWDDEEYSLAEGLEVEKDMPYVAVFLKFEQAVASEGDVPVIDGSVTGKSAEDEVYAYLTGVLGFNKAVACGIMANIQYESSFQSEVYGDNGTSYGLCQWHASRLTSLKSFCSQYGYDYRSVSGQLRYMDYELKNAYSNVKSKMNSISNTANGAYEAAYLWCIYYEVPANKESKAVTRGNLARNTYWPSYASSTSGNDGATSTSSGTLTPTGLKTGWLTYNGYTFYIDKTGYPVCNKWLQVDGKWYYFNSQGVMQKGLISYAGKKYYMNANGVMQYGWQKINSKWYYFNKSTGVATGNGWLKVDGKWYYFDKNCIMQTGWVKLNNIWYYLKPSGDMATGWVKVSNVWYYLKSSGAMATGWQKVSGKWYYLKSSGAMATGWLKLSGKWYYFNSSGAMTTGWQKVNGKYYYMNTSGVMKTGWITVSNKKYYLDSTGARVTGWKTISGKKYYFQSSGVMKTGWLEYNGNKYFLRTTTGEMAIGWFRIDGKICYFDSNGVYDSSKVYGTPTPTPTPTPTDENIPEGFSWSFR